MVKIIRKLFNAYAYHKLRRNINLSVCGSSTVEYSRVNYKKRENCCLHIGERSLILASVVFEKDGAKIEIGKNTFVGYCTISCAESVRIGANVQIAWGVIIFDHNSHSLDYVERRRDLNQALSGKKSWIDVPVSPTIIEDDVWIGANVIILSGVTIGRGAVVGAGSVVTKSIPEMSLYSGNPARLIKRLDDRKNSR